MEIDWPPLYTLRRTKRAKRINLRLCPERGLTLVVPSRTSERSALEFLNQQKSWIFKHRELLLPKIKPLELPAEIYLNAIEKIWKVRYEKIAGYKKTKLLQLPGELVLYSESLELKDCIHQLKEWLYLIAEKELYLWLKQLSQQYQLPFNQLSIRNQSTRWGSCNHQKNINLNVKLLFLPREITEYILIHELCHTRHLNHSEKFWHLVETFVPNYQQQILHLKKIKSSYFPAWI